MKRFAQVGESQITEAMVKDFTQKMLGNVRSDCIVVGAGPSGLMAGRELAQKGYQVLIIEANNYLGGGFWIGGYLMNGVTVRAPAEEELKEMGIPYRQMEEGLYLADGPHACARLIAATLDAGAKVINMTRFDDVVLREENRVAGVVVNWTPVSTLPRQITCVDPIALEAKAIIDATGHEACVAHSLAKRKLMQISGFGGMWVEKSEDLLVERTGLIHPGLIVAGMAVATVFGLPRMGPTFGGMLLSGKKAAEEAEKWLHKERQPAVSPLKEEMMV